MSADGTHDPGLTCWVQSANSDSTDFPIQNLPVGLFRAGGAAHVGVAIGDEILDVTRLWGVGSVLEVFADGSQFRGKCSDFLRVRTPGYEDFLVSQGAAEMLLPCAIGDYTDFYASIDHAMNVGRMFRPDNPLLPNYRWVPIAYHGRSSSVVVSGTGVRRPSGQILPKGETKPIFAPTRMLDYEVELGAVIGVGNEMGQPIPIGDAEGHLAGVVLLNDWSARDIQSWEYQPLGPFLGKNFATSISPWIVTREALEPFRCAATDHAETLGYLKTAKGAYGITMEVWLRTARMGEPMLVSRGDFSRMYWTLGQMIAHHTSNGCPLRAGDLLGSGTVSGPEKENRGCLLEVTMRGAEPLQLPSGETRRFLEDGDEVILRGWCEREGFRRIGLGECRGVVLPQPSALTATD